ncbi:pentapeptide repeat-containing protein [Nocardia sp. NPDC127526]|uniref:pentapeptide repeat-containing protein n=1 Tax=Nocardia sp. NPDC127526 TaxID=3345393 RepID=UPI0036294839
MHGDFTEATFFSANLTNAHLGGANLTDADLRKADLTGADLAGANLAGVYFDETTKWPGGSPPPGVSARYLPREVEMARCGRGEFMVSIPAG